MYEAVKWGGLGGLVMLVVGLWAVIGEWRVVGSLWTRVGLIAAGAGVWVGILFHVRVEPHVLSFLYLMVMPALVVAHAVALYVAVSRIDWKAQREKSKVHPLVRRGVVAERGLDFAAAVKAYDDYIEAYGNDAAVLGRLAEALIKTRQSERALSVLTLAFAEAEKPKRKIAFGIRLAEVILVAKRDPVAARTQLELVRGMYKGTEHEGYIEALAAELIKRVGEGRYLKKKA